MTLRFCLSFALLSAAWAQTPNSAAARAAAAAKAAVENAKPAAPGSTETPATAPVASQTIPLADVSNVMSMPPTQVVATVDGVKVTAGNLQMILNSLPQQAQQQALANRRQLLQQYGVMVRLSGEAEKAKRAEQSPWKEQLSMIRMQMLAQAEMSQKINAMDVPLEDQKKRYETEKDRFYQAKIKAIYIPFTAAPVSQPDSSGKKLLTEQEAKAKAEDLLKQTRAGADFGKLAKEHSADPTSAAKGGEFGVIHKTDQVSEDVKSAVFAAKAGEAVGPVRQPSGFWIFRVEEIGQQPFDDVQRTIEGELRDVRFREWMNKTLESIDIKEESIEMSVEEVKPGTPVPSAPAPAPAPSAPAPARK